MSLELHWDAIGALAELLGALGVIISLVYLALQIRQNSALQRQTMDIARANAAVTSASYGSEFVRAVAMDPEASRIWGIGGRDFERLSGEERQRFDLLMIAQLIQTDANLSLLRSGTLDPEVHEIWERLLEDRARHPRFQELWRAGTLRRLTTRALAERIDALLEQPVPQG